MEFLQTYILVWQLPVALAIAALAILPIRNAYRQLRIGEMKMLDHGAVEQAFMASLWIGIAAIVYPYMLALIVVVWMIFMRKHLMTLRAWMASGLALILCTFWYLVIYHLLPITCHLSPITYHLSPITYNL